jgi:hypothetical protein
LPPPSKFVNVASKGVRFSLSLLESAFAEIAVTVASKELKLTVRLDSEFAKAANGPV